MAMTLRSVNVAIAPFIALLLSYLAISTNHLPISFFISLAKLQHFSESAKFLAI